ncbi:hypothetical protein ACC772_39215, partial [Rhizobium ruizarguesonis]
AGQTFPPVAVLALAVPATGFGAMPTLIALFLYGLLPIFENIVAVQILMTVATFSPSRISGRASGRSTRNSRCVPFMPMPSAA